MNSSYPNRFKICLLSQIFPFNTPIQSRVTVRRGFTLIELLTVIAIIGILAAIIIPVVGKVRESARQAQSTGNLRSLYMAILSHANDQRGNLVVANSSRIDPTSGTSYGSWGNQLTRGRYTSHPAPSTRQNPLMGCAQQLSQFPQSLANMTTSGYYTFAMNARVGHNPNSGLAVGQHGARRIQDFVNPSRSALLMNGVWNGTQFSGTAREDNYVSSMRGGVSRPPFNNSVLVLYAGGNISRTSLDDIPGDRSSEEGRDFWLGGVWR